MKLWTSGVKAILLVLGFVLLMPQPGHAIPAFARKYGVKCYTCHTIPPALNKNGYMFKRLGYRMPPDEMDGTKPAPKITELDKDIKFSLTNSLAVLLQGSFTVDKNIAETGDGTPTIGLNHLQLQPGRSRAVCGRSRAGDRLLLLRPLRAVPGRRATVWSRALASTPAAAPTAATSSRPARCTCRKAREHGRPCSTTCFPIPHSR